MITINSIKEALELPGSTLSPASVNSFQKYLDTPWSGFPVEACWNTFVPKMDKKGNLSSSPKTYILNYLCLRPFNGNNQTDAFMMKTTNKDGRPEIVKKFYDYLDGPDSPWAQCHDYIARVRPDKNGIPDAYLLFNVKDVDIKLAVNLFTAMRLHTCWGLDWVWDKLISAGFSTEEAILLASNFSYAGQTITGNNGSPHKYGPDPMKHLALSKFGVSKTDMPFLTNYNASGFTKLLDKKPTITNSRLSAGAQQPNSFIWNDDEVAVNADNVYAVPNATLKVSSEKETPLFKYLREGLALKKDFVAGVKKALRNNTLIEV